MRLSEAMRLGAMLRPQAYGAFTDGVGTCAFGAANEALGLDVNDSNGYEFEALISHKAKCPVVGCGCRRRIVATVVHHLNDEHYWTREQIADWVESIERAQEQQPAPQPVAVDK